MNMISKLSLGALSMLPAVVFAAVPADVTTAIEAAETDGLAVAGSLLGVSVAIWGALYIKRKFFG
jgi:hypothetical protein